VVVLDTNHLSVLAIGGPKAERLLLRLDGQHEEVTTTVVSVEERINGWIVEIRRRPVQNQAAPYGEFYRQVETYARWIVLPWDQESVDLFQDFRRKGVRIGTMDLKIACITLAHDALLLTQNSVDFAKVPGLRFENWL
jgi:tRNA(fMet)-specific endonuclease VapC